MKTTLPRPYAYHLNKQVQPSKIVYLQPIHSITVNISR
ncbi:MAG: hypothetical protein RL172_3105 [Bacteroidota bacterium]|jgi:hypothetical protein